MRALELNGFCSCNKCVFILNFNTDRDLLLISSGISFVISRNKTKKNEITRALKFLSNYVFLQFDEKLSMVINKWWELSGGDGSSGGPLQSWLAVSDCQCYYVVYCEVWSAPAISIIGFPAPSSVLSGHQARLSVNTRDFRVKTKFRPIYHWEVLTGSQLKNVIFIYRYTTNLHSLIIAWRQHK